MKKNPKSPIKKNRCPRCNKFISPRFPMHICEPISTIDIKGTATLEDTDLGVRWGHASGPAIEPPEEEYKIATVELHIDLAQLGGIDDGLQEGFDSTITNTTIEYDTETGELVIELTLEGYMTLRRHGAVYERPIR